MTEPPPSHPDRLLQPLWLAQAAQAYLEYAQELGLGDLGVKLAESVATPTPQPRPESLERLASPPPAPARRLEPGSPPSPQPTSQGPSPPPPSPAQPLAAAPPPPRASNGWAQSVPNLDRVTNLEELRAYAQSCQACVLARPRKAFGQGAVNPPLMIVLEPPLTEENWPAGPAGELLTNIITLGLGLAVEKTYVSTILKCPLQNLEFWPRQAKNACLEIIWREIALVNPRAILAMGVGPGQLLTKTNKQMFFLRPNPFLLHFPPPLQPIPLQVTLGLGSILEEPELKPEAWRDIKKAMRLAGLT